MKNDPTLKCQCGGRFLAPAFAYDHPPVGETRFDLKGRAYRRRYDCCTLCGHWFARHDLDLSGLYDQDYVAATYGGLAGMRQKFEAIMALPPEKSDNRQRVKRVCDFARNHWIAPSKGPRLLDVGAGLGVFPAAMGAAGWQATALEADSRSLLHLRTVAGVETLELPLLELDAAQLVPFDLITFNKVLEHVTDPVELLTAAKALLLQNGFMYLEVPDVAAAEQGPGREEFFIEHLHVFSPESLAMIASNAGYCLIRMDRFREPSGKYTLSAFLTVS